MVGSKRLGGAERWFCRFSAVLAEQGIPAELTVRAGSELERVDLPLPLHRLPFWTVWDPISQKAVSRLIRRIKPDIVQTYMGRATHMTWLESGACPVHIARLGEYYRLHPYRHAHAWIGNTKGLCDWMVQQGLPANRVFTYLQLRRSTPTVTPRADHNAAQRVKDSLGRPGIADRWALGIGQGSCPSIRGLVFTPGDDRWTPTVFDGVGGWGSEAEVDGTGSAGRSE